jgi:hypothetical protein
LFAVGVTEDSPPGAGGIRPLGRVVAIAVVVGFTWYAEKAFKALMDALS